MKNNFGFITWVVLFTLPLATFSQELRLELNSGIAKYQHDVTVPFKYHPNLGFGFSYIKNLSDKSGISVGIERLTHAYQSDFAQTINRQTEIYGSVNVWGIPVTYVQELTSKGAYFAAGVGLSMSKTSVTGRIIGSTNENISAEGQSISFTSLDKRTFTIVPQIGLGQKFSIGEKASVFAELNARYYSRIPDVTIFRKVNSEEPQSFASPNSAMVYQLRVGYIFALEKDR